MKKRMIDPEIFSDDRLGNCGAYALSLYIGLLCSCDVEGKLEDRPRKIQAKIFPYNPTLDVNQCLNEMVQAGLLIRYEVEGVKVILVNNFDKMGISFNNEKAYGLPNQLPTSYPPAGHQLNSNYNINTNSNINKGECEGEEEKPKPKQAPKTKSKTPTLERIARDELGHVLLSNDEFEKLEKKYPKLLEGITRLSDWIEAKKGQRAWFYKSYSSAFSYLNPISCWVWREVEKQSTPPNRGGFETKAEKNMRYLRESLERSKKRDTKIIDLSKPQHLNLEYVSFADDDSPFFYGEVVS